MKKFRSLFAIILAIGLMMAMVACGGGGETNGGETNNDWTVTVLDVDGNPYTSVGVQPCVFGENGVLEACYGPYFTLDSNGTIVLKVGEHIIKEDADEVEIHLAKLPVYLTFNHTIIKKGESKTVQAKFKEESDLKAKTGSGTEADPYTILAGTENNPSTNLPEQIVYGFKLTEEGQKLIFAVTFDANDNYTINTYRADAKIVKLSATADGFEATETTGDNTLEVSATEGETVYFEVSLNGEASDNLAYLWIA